MATKQQWSIVLALAASGASAVEAPVLSVTLYPGSATVERLVQVAPGMTQVEITGLLANFNTDTVRLQADPGIQVGQVLRRARPGRGTEGAGHPVPRAAGHMIDHAAPRRMQGLAPALLYGDCCATGAAVAASTTGAGSANSAYTQSPPARTTPSGGVRSCCGVFASATRM